MCTQAAAYKRAGCDIISKSFQWLPWLQAFSCLASLSKGTSYEGKQGTVPNRLSRSSERLFSKERRWQLRHSRISKSLSQFHYPASPASSWFCLVLRIHRIHPVCVRSPVNLKFIQTSFFRVRISSVSLLPSALAERGGHCQQDLQPLLRPTRAMFLARHDLKK